MQFACCYLFQKYYENLIEIDQTTLKLYYQRFGRIIVFGYAFSWIVFSMLTELQV